MVDTPKRDGFDGIIVEGSLIVPRRLQKLWRDLSLCVEVKVYRLAIREGSALQCDILFRHAEVLRGAPVDFLQQIGDQRSAVRTELDVERRDKA